MDLNTLAYYAQQGTFVSLDEYNITQYPNIAAAFEEFPTLPTKLTGLDGKMYGLPDVNWCLHCMYSGGRMWYYMPFARDNDLKVPETLDEFTEYLQWIKDNDANGNGDPNDEIPLAFSKGSLHNTIACFAKSFMPFVGGGKYGHALEDGEIVAQITDSRFRDSLAYLNELYEKGLMLEDSFSIESSALKELGETPAGQPFGVITTSWSDGHIKAGESGRWFDTFILAPLEGANGDRWSGNNAPHGNFGAKMFITDKCENPEVAIALYDYLVGFEVQMNGYLGPEDECWEKPEEGAIGINGKDALYKLLVTYGTQRDTTGWNVKNPMNMNMEFRYKEEAVGYDVISEYLATGNPELRDEAGSYASYNEINNYSYTMNTSALYDLPTDMLLPPLLYTEDDSARMAEIDAVLDPYLEQTWTAFITGTRDIDTEWDAYLEELESMGAIERVEILQRTYDAIK